MRAAKFFTCAGKHRLTHRLLAQVLSHRKDGNIEVITLKARPKKMLTVKQWKDAFDSDSEYSNEIPPIEPEKSEMADSGKG